MFQPYQQLAKQLLLVMAFFIAATVANKLFAQSKANDKANALTYLKTIHGNISPKSVVASGKGLFYAQNMMYRHTVTVYDEQGDLLHTIKDAVKLSDHGFDYSGSHNGAPVECAFTSDGRYAWVSNYQMYGNGFSNPGKDACGKSDKYDNSFIYQIDTKTSEIQKVVEVGSVPKYVAVTPDDRLVLVTNWCSGDVSVIDALLGEELDRIDLGRYPRGIATHPEYPLAFIAIMGGSDIAVYNYEHCKIQWIRNIGRGPRHIVISPDGKYLYVTLNNEGKTAQVDLLTGEVLRKVNTGRTPRSMTISEDGKYLYIVQYHDNQLVKLLASDMSVLSRVKTNDRPIGVTFDAKNNNVWVACYSGSIMIFEDQSYKVNETGEIAALVETPSVQSKEESSLPKSKVSEKKEEKAAAVTSKESKPVQVKTPKTNSQPKPKPKAKPKPAPSLANKKKLPVSNFKHHIIGGNFSTLANAEVFAKELRAKGYKGIILPTEKGTYRVAYAGYNDHMQAQEAAIKIRWETKKSAWVLTK